MEVNITNSSNKNVDLGISNRANVESFKIKNNDCTIYFSTITSETIDFSGFGGTLWYSVVLSKLECQAHTDFN